MSLWRDLVAKGPGLVVNPKLSHRDIEELLGAFALDAVDVEEASLIEGHLLECPRCRAEVADHRQTATLLVEDRLEPPATLWDRLSAGLEEVPPPIDLARLSRARATRRRIAPQWLAVAAAVAAVLGVGSLGLQQQRRVDHVESVLSSQEIAVEALAAFNDPRARLATLRSPDGAEQIRSVLLRDGTGYVLADRLPDLPDDQTYQLWAMIDGRTVSAGLLGPEPDIARFRTSSAAVALAISVERAGGAEQPSLPTRLIGLLA